MTTATKPPARFGPGADLLGCTVVLVDTDRVILRCPGRDGNGCDAAFAVAGNEAHAAARKGLVYRCPGCGWGARLRPLPAMRRPMTAPGAGTAGAALLLTAFDLWGDGEFGVWALTVAAWKRDPGRFGIPGHPYPNTNRVIIELCKTRPLGFSRYVERTAPNTFRLTADGLIAAKALRAAR